MSTNLTSRLARLEAKAGAEDLMVHVNTWGHDGAPIKVFTLNITTGERHWEYPPQAPALPSHIGEQHATA